MPYSETENRILDVAQELVQTKGFNAFSYKDLANVIGIKTSSIHYHFASKSDLGIALMSRYRETFFAALDEIDSACKGAAEKLDRYVQLFRDVLNQGDRICLCGMLASDYHTLSDDVQAEVKTFIDENEDWLAAVIEAGQNDGSITSRQPAREAASAIYDALEGALIAANVFKDDARFSRAARTLMDGLGVRRS